MTNGDKRRRRALLWTWPPPVIVQGYSMPWRPVWRRFPPRRRGLVYYRPWPSVGNPDPVPFAAPRYRPTQRLRPRPGLVVARRILPFPSPFPFARATKPPTLIRRGRSGLVIARRFASPGNPAPQPILKPVRPPTLIRPRRPGRAILRPPASPGNSPITPPPGQNYSLRASSAFATSAQSRRRMGAARIALLVPPPPAAPPPSGGGQWTCRALICLRPRPPRPGRVISFRQAQGLFPGRALIFRRPAQRRPGPARPGAVFARRLVPTPFVQPTPPPRPTLVRPRWRARPGLVGRYRGWYQPQGGGTPTNPIDAASRRARPRPGQVYTFRPGWVAPDLVGVTQPYPDRPRPLPRRGIVLLARRLYVGDTNREAFPPVRPIATSARPRPRRGLVVQQRTLWSPPACRPLTPVVVVARRPARRPIAARPASMPWSPTVSPSRPLSIITAIRRAARVRGIVLSARRFPPSAGTVAPTTVRVRPAPRVAPRRGRVIRPGPGGWIQASPTIAVYPDPYAATEDPD